ncbi:MAG: response regulator [Pseudomonadales bacterium]|nr:response regulator [Pseudomonadales bacterium]MCP5357162.1 response regulator [Pseudomonadales bacterium]
MDAEITPNPRPVQVLLVDDSRRVRESAQALLNRSSFQVHLADNGFDALCKVVAHRPDIVFMDAVMPELDGFESCSLIRGNPHYAHIPIVLMVSDHGPLAQARADVAGASALLVKPFGRRELLGLLEEFLGGAEGGENAQGQTQEEEADAIRADR